MIRLSLVTVLILGSFAYSDDDPLRLFPNRSEIKDVRLGKPRDLNDYFPFTPPTSKESWNDRSKHVPHADACCHRSVADAGKDAIEAGHPRQDRS